MPFLVITEINGDTLDTSTAKFLQQPYEFAVGTVIELPAAEMRVGRTAENDLVLPCSSISRTHFRIFPEDGRYIFEHLGGRQFPIYNGQMVYSGALRREMQDGDTFREGGVCFRYLGSAPNS